MEEKLLFDFNDIPTAPKTKTYIDADEYQSIVLKSEVKKDEYTNYIQDTFDLKVGDVSKVCIPNKLNIDSFKDWNIGVICGASGSGKSTILKHLAKQRNSNIANPTFDSTKCLISNFDTMTPKDATMLLAQMGLASVPTWIRPFNVLSNGEQYRASLAKAVSESVGNDIIYVDEYTSVVDRNVAMSMSNALQKYIRRNNKRIILATCHYDIFDWLRPDWIYDLNKGGTLERGDYLRRPKIELQVYRTTSDTWSRFKKHHYITDEMNMGAYSYCFEWRRMLVGFCSVLANPGKGLQDAWRISRVVVLPDFQALGIGRSICDFISGIYLEEGKRMYIKTVNPALGEYFATSKKWNPTGYNGRERSISNQDAQKYANRLTRKSYCYKYTGQPISGYEDLLLSTEELRRKRANKCQLSLF